MTPFDSFDEDYIQIGLASQNEGVDIASLRYDYTQLSYAPESKQKDTSKPIAGTKNAYDETPASEVVVEVVQPDAADVKEQSDEKESKALEVAKEIVEIPRGGGATVIIIVVVVVLLICVAVTVVMMRKKNNASKHDKVATEQGVE